MKIKHVTHLLKRFDYVLIIFFIITSFFPFFIMFRQQRNIPTNAQIYAVISIGGQIIERIALDENEHFLYTYTADHGLVGNQYNLVEMYEGRIRVKQDNSPDQVGVNMGWISRPGQTIVVLPHRFLIQIEAVREVDSDEIIRPF